VAWTVPVTWTHWPFWQANPTPQAGEHAIGWQVSVAASHVVPVPHWPTQTGVAEEVSHDAQPG
jgi:hypothetical protein